VQKEAAEAADKKWAEEVAAAKKEKEL